MAGDQEDLTDDPSLRNMPCNLDRTSQLGGYADVFAKGSHERCGRADRPD
jgi:hypothetical protein